MARNRDYQAEAERVLKYPTYYYQTFRLLDGDLLSAQEQRRELSRLLSVARKRQQRLQRSEFAEGYFANMPLPKVRDLQSERDVSRALADVALMLRSRQSLVQGARAYQEEVRETLRETFADMPEVDFDKPDFNWKQFGRFMQQMKKAGKASEGADSARAVRMYFIARKIGLTPAGLRDNYDEFLQRQEQMQQLYESNPFGRRSTSGADMLARLDSLTR